MQEMLGAADKALPQPQHLRPRPPGGAAVTGVGVKASRVILTTQP